METGLRVAAPSAMVLLAVLFGGCSSVKPGFRTAITSKGLNYGEKEGGVAGVQLASHTAHVQACWVYACSVY